MIFTVPAVGGFGVISTATIDPNVGYPAGSLQNTLATNVNFTSINAQNSTVTVSTADTTIDQTLVVATNLS